MLKFPFLKIAFKHQYSCHDTVLSFCNMLPMGETGWIPRISLYNFLQLHVNLQLSQKVYFFYIPKMIFILIINLSVLESKFFSVKPKEENLNYSKSPHPEIISWYFNVFTCLQYFLN